MSVCSSLIKPCRANWMHYFNVSSQGQQFLAEQATTEPAKHNEATNYEATVYVPLTSFTIWLNIYAAGCKRALMHHFSYLHGYFDIPNQGGDIQVRTHFFRVSLCYLGTYHCYKLKRYKPVPCSFVCLSLNTAELLFPVREKSKYVYPNQAVEGLSFLLYNDSVTNHTAWSSTLQILRMFLKD